MMRRRPIGRLAVDTAVVAGTATAVSGRAARRQQQNAQPVAQQAPAATPTQAPGDHYDELERLGQLHEQGILTDEEFAAQKAKILG